MADGVNWGVQGPNYGVFAPQPINWAALSSQQQQQQPAQQQPGQPLNIQSPAQQAATNPNWMDRLRQFFTNQGTNPPAPQQNVVVPSGTADVGVPASGPVQSPAPTPQLTPYSMDQYLLDRYGTIGSNYYSTMEGRQAGGPVYAPRMMRVPPGYTAGGTIV
jgi:hypothetical protein